MKWVVQKLVDIFPLDRPEYTGQSFGDALLKNLTLRGPIDEQQGFNAASLLANATEIISLSVNSQWRGYQDPYQFSPWIPSMPAGSGSYQFHAPPYSSFSSSSPRFPQHFTGQTRPNGGFRPPPTHSVLPMQPVQTVFAGFTGGYELPSSSTGFYGNPSISQPSTTFYGLDSSSASVYNDLLPLSFGTED
ncbi:hypothetical protein RHSIM_Rhsim13G0163800 [Rhododendron simsii]|uniref:Uncharacterized protein n=1 Tax=Rhododendron simsii TaxID=118357 RepID=A0A834FY72_RHOSS|nr:hypothetical protein RHSIM_Rhsim13G0163800 [Rhododendron simsii]